MEIDRETIKALSSDTRVEMLKLLSERRRMPAEISRALELAPSTVVEHLQKLEEVGLVERKETGYKWVYYEITEKGKNLIKPKIPVQIILSLTIGAVMTFIGASRVFVAQTAEQAAPEIANMAEESAKLAAPLPLPTEAVPETAAQAINMPFAIVLLLGLLLVIFGFIKLRKFAKQLTPFQNP